MGLLAANSFSFAAIYYVGQGPTCNGSNDFDSLALALLAAGLNGTESDEIRLTNTVTYQGSGDGTHVLANWNSSSLGLLEIIGGYAECGSSNSSGTTEIGNGNDVVFRVKSQSQVVLKNLSITGSPIRGIVVEESAVVGLVSVDVSGNQAGIRVLGGSYLSIDADSVVSDNGSIAGIPKGGGVWCFGTDSYVGIQGRVLRNKAEEGGNIHIADGCILDLVGAAEVRGDGNVNAVNGGGIMIDNGGEIFAFGNSSRVKITDHSAERGGGLYIRGSGLANFSNVFVGRNDASFRGSAIYAIDGGTSSTQVKFDRAASCDFLISCSEIQNHTFSDSVVYVNNSKVDIFRTLIELNQFNRTAPQDKGMVTAENGALVRIAYSSMTLNEAYYLVLNNNSTVEMTHVTAAGNTFNQSTNGNTNPFAWYNLTGSSDEMQIENSIFQDTQGGLNLFSSNFSGKCNLVDDSDGWLANTFLIGTATFQNLLGGDARQVAASEGVDMCLEDSFPWNNDKDIEYQDAPVNEDTNLQGSPGEPGGIYDAGFDEVYDNINGDQFLLTVEREGSGSGFVISEPAGISCGLDCSEVVFSDTLVKLSANAASGSYFDGWVNCPLPNFSECFITVTQSAAVTAIFQPDDLIFSDDFE